MGDKVLTTYLVRNCGRRCLPEPANTHDATRQTKRLFSSQTSAGQSEDCVDLTLLSLHVLNSLRVYHLMLHQKI